MKENASIVKLYTSKILEKSLFLKNDLFYQLPALQKRMVEVASTVSVKLIMYFVALITYNEYTSI